MSLGDVYDDLENHLAPDATWSTGEGEGASFVIDSLSRADWAARKVARARRRLAEAEMVAAAEQRRIAEWVDEQRARCEQETGFLVELLVRYHRSLLDEDPKRRTVSLPGGASLVARKSPDSLIVEDETAATEWCRKFYPAALVVSERLDKPTLKRRLSGTLDAETGELVPGLVMQTGEITYRVKTDGEAGDP